MVTDIHVTKDLMLDFLLFSDVLASSTSLIKDHRFINGNFTSGTIALPSNKPLAIRHGEP